PAPGRGTRAPVAAVAGGPTPRRSRLTGRAAILVLVLAVLTVSYASSLRAYLQQRSHINELKSDIAEREASITSLEREKRSWQDPAFVRQQAREHLGYVMPGSRSYVVLDEDGEPLDRDTRLHDPDTVLDTEPTPWWDDAWASVELAGDPPPVTSGPATEIDGSKEKKRP
ncbi:septum formation initiator family protein, partial [Nocardioides sp. SYSU D00038]|uniref:FtsB family cell division protein n=1 Tax=Nocardioides sp. SYSU D00038 TaxID=2812554 RepID=UPI001F082F50